MRRAIGLWQAIMIILIVSGIMMIALRFSQVSAKHTADSYVHEQAELFLNSAVEIAMLQISGYDRAANGDCLRSVTVNSPDNAYRAVVRVQAYYLLENSPDAARCGALTRAIGTEESHGMVLLETEVSSARAYHPVRILRRSLQRP